MKEGEIYAIISGLRGVGLETLERWCPDEGCSWSCVKCDYWTPDNPPPEECPICAEVERGSQ